MLGTSYALLRRQFLKWAGWRREIPAVARNVLVTLGGGELGSVIFNVIQGIRQLNTAELEVVVVVGADNPQVPAIRANLAGQTFPARLEQNTVDMAQLMGWADVGITAGGGTSWEAAFMGLPDLVIIMAENQRPSAERLGTIGAAVNLGWHEKLSPGYITDVLEKVLRSGALREDMMHLGRNLVDGRGATRVLSYLQDHC
jgi:spore coat polysaccharide biosynthesis predicted glycosyltransferase SpsG